MTVCGYWWNPKQEDYLFYNNQYPFFVLDLAASLSILQRTADKILKKERHW